MSATYQLDEKKLVLTPREVSKVLGIALPNVYVLIQRRKLPSIRITENRIIVPVNALKKHLDALAAAGTALG